MILAQAEPYTYGQLVLKLTLSSQKKNAGSMSPTIIEKENKVF